jgi:squalene-associated FAD-dependent desaturase
VFLRCCSAYRALLARLGSERLTTVQRRFEIPVLKPGRRPVTLRRGSLPAPFQFATALARYPHLTIPERLGAARAALALMRLRVEDPRLDELTFGDWLARYEQGPSAVAALWDLIALPALNLPAAHASLASAAFVFHTGLFSANDAGDIGFHDATLSEIIGEPARRALAEGGVEVRLGWRAEALEQTGDGLEVHGGGRDGLSAEAVVMAIPHVRAVALLEPLLGERARALRGLGASPIVNLHVVYDRVVCERPFLAGVGTPVQYVFDRTRAAGAPAGCQYLAVSLSGAERDMGTSVDKLRERYLPALSELLPRARGANVEQFLVTREHAATLRAAPGTAALRPTAATSVPGLVLAGAWTDTGGWPATLEGAVLSGHSAARHALAALDVHTQPALGASA